MSGAFFPSGKALRFVGKDVPRQDALDKVRGAVRYGADEKLQGMLSMKLLLSPIARGRVTAFDAGGAEAMEGVHAVYSFRNVPPTRFNSAVSFPGQDDPRDEVMFTDRPLYEGDRIAAVVAETPEQAEEAVRRIRVEYREEPPLLSFSDAEKPPLQDIPDEEMRLAFSCGETERALEEAEHVFTDTVMTPRIHHAAMEPHCCLAWPEGNGGVAISSPCQLIFAVRYVVAGLLELPLNRVRVIKAPMGGTFGGKQEVILESLAAYAALQLQRPVQVVTDRCESIAATRCRAASRGIMTTAVDRDGNILARSTEALVDAGAYTSGSKRVCAAMGKKLFRLYRIPHQSYRGRVFWTDTVPGGACRGYGSPQIHTIGEIHTDLVARRMGFDPVAFRLKNVVEPWDDDPIGGPNLGDARIRECLEEGAQAFRWQERKRQPRGDGLVRRGVGVAAATHGNGYYGTPYPDFTTLALRVNEDGSAVLETGFHELGNGTLTVMAQIVAEVLSIPPDRITVTEGDTRHSPMDAGCVASRVTYACGRCAMEVAERVREQIFREAAALWEVAAERVSLEDGHVAAGPDRSMGLDELVGQCGRRFGRSISAELCWTTPSNPASFGAHFAAVEVDTGSGLVRVADYVAAHDVGQPINPRMVRGQIYGGVQMGIGMALSEEIVYDGKGRLKNGSLGRYHLVNAPDMPEVEVLLVEGGEGDDGPFGAKSIGEICTVPVAAAVVNAVNDALETELTSLPLTPERILGALS
ncbi:MAG: xanthine dehydrogenase family protein molybdopterin-binding subunit [Synergistales bacterium]|nr:xanthine dehydrogenase family protein molybdopterin-binding subunit [Synergistales bacterium]